MPLRMKCTSCKRELMLDRAFLGASCRCQFCRHLVQVPPAMEHGRPRPHLRPTDPPLASQTRATSAAPKATPPTPVPSGKLAFLRTRRGRYIVGGFAACLLAAASSTVVFWPAQPAPVPATIAVVPPPPSSSAPIDDALATAFDPVRSLRTANPHEHYFGIPVTGKVVGCVVDSDSTMSRYIDRVAFVTNSVISATPPGTRRFGVVKPVNEDRRTLVEVAEPSSDLAGASGLLLARLPGGKTDFAKAVSATNNWYADQLFLVLSKRLDDGQLAILAQSAAQTGAMTHVIAVGDAAKQDLSSISSPTGGHYIAVADADLDSLVKRTDDANNEPTPP